MRGFRSYSSAALFMALVGTLAGGVPPPRPASFFGTVTAGGENAPTGTRVSTWISGVQYAESTVFTADGLSVYRLDVPGDLPGTPAVEGGQAGQTVVFKVGGAQVQTAPWQEGSASRLDLTATFGPDLTVSVDDGVTLAAPGASLTYTILVTNHGPGAANGVVVRDTLSSGTTFSSASDGGTHAGGVVTWPAFNLNQGQTATRTVTAQVKNPLPAGIANLTNVAAVADDGTQGLDPNPDDNTDADVDTLDAAPDVAVTVDNGVSEVLPGQRLEYRITVSNSGTREATGVVLRNTLPADVTYFAASDSGVEAGGVITWPQFDLAQGASVTRTFTARVNSPLPPSASSLADTAEATSGNGDRNPANNTFTDLDPVVQKPDLTVSVDAADATTDPQSLAISGSVTVELSNGGNLDATDDFALVAFEDRDGNGAYSAGADALLGQVTVTDPVLAGGSTPVAVPVSGTVLFKGNRISAFADSGLAVAEQDETNNVGHTGQDCGNVPAPGDFEPVLELNWPRPGIVEPFVVDSASSPVVVDLDGNGVPDIVFTTSNLDQALGSFDQSVLRAIRGDTGAAIFDVQSFYDGFRFWEFELATVAAGDIDLDGKPEIITTNLGISVTGEPVNAITAYEHNGARKWRSPVYSTHPQGRWNNRDNPTIADIDRNGVPEILVGAHVFNNNGSLRWKGTGGQAFQSIFNTNGPASGAISLAADLDLTGNLEVVTGNTAYRSDGTIYWQIPYGDGYPAVANFDADPFPEIVVVSQGTVRLHEHDGALKWGPVTLPGRTPVAGGPPTVADFDADGQPEIGVASSDFYAVFETDGTVKWQRTTQDFSSGMTGSTVFDFDGDGRFEVVYRDEVYLRIYRGEDGVVLAQFPVPSTTLNEQPTVADVDLDGNAEILVTADHGDSDSGIPGNASNAGLRVFGDANDKWVGTRSIWNQHAYSVGNVNDDATIPRDPDWSWLTHNTYRAQIAPPGTALYSSPDLTASYAVMDLSAYPTVTVTVRVGNGGGAPVKTGLPVAFYDEDGGPLLGVKNVSKTLRPGEYEDVSFTFTESDFADRTVVFVADDDGTGKSRDQECDETNNRYAYTYDIAVLGLTLSMSDGQTAVGAGETFTYNLTVFNAAGHQATGVALTDQIPPHTSVVSASDGGTESGGVVAWPAFNLASGSTASRSLTLLVSEAVPVTVTALTNQASVTDDGTHGPDPTPANNSASDTNKVSTVRARAGGPYDGDEGAAISFDASGSTDRDGTIVSYEWDLDADGAFDDATGATASRSFPDEGSFTVAVKVTDNSGETDTDTAQVTVRNAAPGVDAGPDRILAENSSATLAGTTFTDAGTADTHTATIDWGDGSPLQAGVVAESAGSGSVAGGHAYPDDGSFTVKVCVSDNDGASACDSFALTVENANPVVTPSGTVDLRNWRPEAYAPGPVWSVAPDGQSVVQTVNEGPAFFYGDFGSFGIRLEGKIRTTDTDDDFMGFALGFRPGDTTNPNADFLIVDWKQVDQTFGFDCGNAVAKRGLAVSRVRGIPGTGELWAHNDQSCNGTAASVQQLARGRTRGNTGWVRGTTYTFTFESTATSLKVWVDGTLEIDITGTFSPGRFAFYNYSQAQVTYSALSTQNLGGEEGSAITARGTFTDVGPRDTHTASLGWGDGSTTPGTVTQGTGSGSVTGAHVYQDEGSYTLNLCVTDDDGGTGCTPIPVTVLNVAPTVNAGPDRLTYSAEESSIAPVTFADPGVLDTHTATIDWGDGQVTPATMTESNGSGSVAGTHTYAANGAYTVKVCVTDNDGAIGCDSFSWQRLDPVLDLRLTKAADRKFARPNQNVIYTLTLANIGTREPQGVVLTDPLPAHLTFVSASDGGVWNAATRTVTWTIAKVAYQQTITRTVTARVDAAPPFNTPAVNTAQVTDDGRFGPDATPADNAASATVILWDGLTPWVDAGADRSVIEGDVVSISAPFNDTTAGEAHTATIDWGDGVTTVGTLSGTSTSGTVSGTHAYPEQGTFTARVCVKDAANRTGCDDVVITVANGAPRVNDDAGVDLRRWKAESYGTGPNWAVSADGKTVTQTVNSVPAIFYSDFPAFGSRVEGTIRVLNGSFVDDDFIGFVLGFLPGDTTSASADYLLVDWKQGNQTEPFDCGNAIAARGLAVSRVTGIPGTGELWAHNDQSCNGSANRLQELARGLTRGSTAWSFNTDYKFTFELSATRLQVFVNGTLELDVAGNFRNGRLGFYNYSQENVRYSSFTFAAKVGDEGQPLEMAPTFGDPGVQDTHTATLEWGDGAITPATVEQGTGFGTVRGTHPYGDNGSYTVRACVTDDEGATGCGSFPVSIRNVAPAVDAGPDRTISFGAPLTGELATFADPGFLDTHTATIAWGDGTTTAGTVTEANGAGTVAGTKTYAATGTRTVQVCVKDDDNAQACDRLTITVVSPPVLSAIKTASLQTDADGNGVVSPGDVLAYEIQVANGGGPATGVTLTDPVPAHAAIVPGSVTTTQGTVTGESPVTVEVGTLTGSVTVRFSVTLGAVFPDGVEQVSNQAAVTSNELPQVLSDDPGATGTANPTVTPVATRPELAASKTDELAVDRDGDGVPGPGDELRYTIAITNSGGGAATGVVLNDDVSDHTQVVAGSVAVSSGTVVTEDPVKVEIGQVGTGETVTVTFRVTIDDPVPAGVREVSNQGVVTSLELPAVFTHDPELGGAAAPTVTTITAAPKLVVEKTDVLAGVPSPGDMIEYRVSILNDGNTSATDVVFEDEIPDHTMLVPGSIETTGTVESEDPLRVAIGEVPGGERVEVTFRVRIDDPIAIGVREVRNQGKVTSHELPEVKTDDPEVGGAEDPTVTAVSAAPVLRVEKTDLVFEDADGVASPGDVVLYSITVANDGNTGASQVVLTDPVVAASGTVQTDQGTVTSEDPVRVEIGEVAAGARVKVSFQVRIDEAFTATELSNQATVESAELEDAASDDPDTPEPADPTRTPVFITPEVAIGDAAVAEAAGQAVLTVTLSKAGNREVRVSWATGTGTAQAGADYTASSGVLTFAPGETSKTLAVPVLDDPTDEPDEGFPVLLTDPVQAKLADAEGAVTIRDDDLPPPELVAAKTAEVAVDHDQDGVPSPGDELRYTVDVRNLGGSPATGVVLTDDVPDHTEVVAGSVAATSGTVVSEDPVKVEIGQIGAGETVTVTFQVTIDDPVPVGVREVSNQGVVTSLELPEVKTDDPEVGGAENPTVTAVSAAPVLRVEKTDLLFEDADENGQASPGDELLYSIIVANDGNTGASQVVLTDPVAASGTVQTDQGTVTSEDPVRVEIGELAAGDRVTISFQVRIDDAATEVSNQATVESAELEDVASDDPDTPEAADPTRTSLFLTPEIAIGDAAVNEGNAGTVMLKVPVTLSAPIGREIRVDFTVAPGTATAGVDYDEVSGTVIFAPGETSRMVEVPVRGDVFLEPDETFFVNLSPAAGIVIQDGQGVGTIRDDEVCPGPELLVNAGGEVWAPKGSLAGWTVDEGGWQRRSSNPAPVQGAWYLSSAGAASPAELWQDVDVSAYGDGQLFRFSGLMRTAAESPSDVARIVVEYRNAGNALVLDAFDTGEIASSAVWRAVLDERAAPAGTSFIRVRLMATRFTGTSPDACFDGLSLVSLKAATLTLGDVRIYEGKTGTAQALFPVRLSCALGTDVATTYSTANGTALAGQDYLAASGSLLLPSGTIAATIPVTVLSDGIHELHETFRVLLGDASPNWVVRLDPVGVGTIVNDDFCARSPGFWKNHQEVWPVTSLVIGGVEHDAAGMMALLSYNGSDASNHLARQLVATELNLLVGSDPSILPVVAQAHELLGLHPPGSKPSSALKEQVNAVKDKLDKYNNSGCQEVPVIPGS